MLMKGHPIHTLPSTSNAQLFVHTGNENRQAREEQERRMEAAAAVKGYRSRAIPGMDDEFEVH